MAALQFKGKNIIWNHHMSVPYHTLELDDKLSYKQERADGNLIIEGDNLLALKSLSPQFTGKIDCIYIDPPYNTGNEGWIYNDNIRNPMIEEWFGKTIDKSDLTKHDKWLCMITPRIKLLYELLNSDGFIAISIDDNEVNNLKTLMNEIFGEDNFIGQITVRSNPRGSQASRLFAIEHEYILFYGKDQVNIEKLGYYKSDDEKDEYNMEESDGRRYRLLGLRQRGGAWRRKDRPKMYYPVYVNPKDGSVSLTQDEMFSIEVLPKRPSGEEGRWTWGKEKFLQNTNYVIGKSINNGIKWDIFRKDYLIQDGEIVSKKVRSIWVDKKYNYQNGRNEIKELLKNADLFDYPKPKELIKDIVNMDFNRVGIVLDAFAGSGTTAQAVLELNEEDKGNRKFILIQMPENSKEEPDKNICRDITRERVVKVIEKKLENKEVGFEYKRVGQPIDAETILSGQLPTYKELAKYVFYLATGQSPKDKDIDEKKYLAGKIDHTEVYLLYTPDMDKLRELALNFEWARDISKGNENKKIVYAPACFMDDEYLEQFNMKFVSIPYNLFEREK